MSEPEPTYLQVQFEGKTGYFRWPSEKPVPHITDEDFATTNPPVIADPELDPNIPIWGYRRLATANRWDCMGPIPV